jgi:CDP-glucose 4,6-dehydratase
VLEPLLAYLRIARFQYNHAKYANSYNVGPDEKDCVRTSYLVEKFCNDWGEGQKWVDQSIEGPHEAQYLKLDCSRIKENLGWEPRWSIDIALRKTIEWTKGYLGGVNVNSLMNIQIEQYLAAGE